MPPSRSSLSGPRSILEGGSSLMAWFDCRKGASKDEGKDKVLIPLQLIRFRALPSQDWDNLVARQGMPQTTFIWTLITKLPVGARESKSVALSAPIRSREKLVRA